MWSGASCCTYNNFVVVELVELAIVPGLFVESEIL